MTIPDYLRKMPDGPGGGEPGRAGVLPLERLSPEDFERLCLHFIARRFPEVVHFRLHGVVGQNQHGYDLIALRPEVDGQASPKRIFGECKRRAKLAPRDVREIVDRVLRDNRVGIDDELWLFTSADMSSKDDELTQLVEDYAPWIRLRILDSRGLSETFFAAPHQYGHLVELFWGRETSERFYNGVDWHAKVIERYRSSDPFCRAAGDERLYELLGSLYGGHALLEWMGRPSPVTVLEEAALPCAPGSCGPKLSLALPEPLPGPDAYPEHFDPAGVQRFFELRAWSERRPKEVFNGLVYTAESVRALGEGRTIDMACGVGRYFLNLATSHGLEDEIVEACNTTGGPLSLDRLPKRRWLHQRVGDPVVDGSARCNAIGGSTLIVFARPDGSYAMIVRERSAQIVAHPFRYHVVPSFMFTPFLNSSMLREEFDFELNVRREYLEELYFEKDLMLGEGQVNPRFFASHPALRRLDRLVASGGANLLYTGLVVNLLNLRPELCTLLLIHDPQWFEEEGRQRGREIHFNPYEFLSIRESHGVPEGVRLNRRLTIGLDLDGNLEPIEPALLARENMVPPAIGAIHLGLRAARRVLEISPAS